MIGRLALGLVLLCLCGAAAAAGAPVAPRASLTDIESKVMCTTCGVPLGIAESPQADQERDFIRRRIAAGDTTAQILHALVAQLGPGVLALPQRRGFNLAVYIVPAALIGVIAGVLAFAVPRWRRHGGDAPAAPDALSPGDAARLDEDLARYQG